jgi:hypothetical protein
MKYTNKQQIDVVVERKMNMLERALIRGDLTQEGYGILTWEVEAWAKDEYSKLNMKVDGGG